ncbi:precorrin-2 C20-methyltransferase [Methanococcus vannielii SB]|uniref:Precorrin-2 C20-methyltransferase n=1 Tax=Methanococcus vannielii (strain ATCC 35089 / DSM 1224 / JCM 13029 / OCM 148 / SB) TaxID=406327 RepID=A6URV5_METVS|nr:precorrin-2 C(20)-methyltransferase [Methanococcus vannielii]ABR55227.1 precorrin-2 C20-methyltransferase [Methanococcus vannielii SB]
MVDKIYGIGVGPGDTDLLTLKSVKILNSVETIFVPISKEGKASVAYEIIKGIIPEDKKVVELLFPMSKDIEFLQKHWENAAKEIINEKGTVAVVTIGDATLYSTFSYVWQIFNKNNIEVEVINGISSPFAAAASLNIPLVEGDEKLAILPQGKDLERYLDEFDTLIVMKTNDLEEKLKNLKNKKDSFLVGVVNRVTSSSQKISLGKIDEIDFEPFKDYLSLAIIKKLK